MGFMPSLETSRSGGGYDIRGTLLGFRVYKDLGLRVDNGILEFVALYRGPLLS